MYVLSEFEPYKFGVLDFTNKFDLEAEVAKANQKIKDIFEKKSMSYDDNKAKNTKLFLIWLIEAYYGEFDKHFGITEGTVKLLPGLGMVICFLSKIAFHNLMQIAPIFYIFTIGIARLLNTQLGDLRLATF